jgi:hypothetical protein
MRRLIAEAGKAFAQAPADRNRQHQGANSNATR